MKTIHKFKLDFSSSKGDGTTFTIDVPKGAIVLSADAQFAPQITDMQENIYVWAEVNNSVLEKEVKTFEIFGTGHPMTNTPKRFIDTVHFKSCRLVFHVYEVI